MAKDSQAAEADIDYTDPEVVGIVDTRGQVEPDEEAEVDQFPGARKRAVKKTAPTKKAATKKAAAKKTAAKNEE